MLLYDLPHVRDPEKLYAVRGRVHVAIAASNVYVNSGDEGMLVIIIDWGIRFLSGLTLSTRRGFSDHCLLP